MDNGAATRLVALPGAMLSMKESDLMLGGRDVMIDLPVPSFVIEHPKGLVLFDTGVNPQTAENPDQYWGRAAKFLNVRFSRNLTVDNQLREHGYNPADVKCVVVSHLHLDHAGGLALFPDAKFFIVKGELAHAYWPEPRLRPAFILGDILPTRGFDWQEVTEDTDLFGDGSLQMLRTAGHTPGECSLFVRLKHSAPVVLTGDTVHIRRQLTTLAPMPTDYDPNEAAESIRRLKRIQDLGLARLWVSHDPEDWKNYPHVME
jgi:N-acyl homoserine lactone hydrolase